MIKNNMPRKLPKSGVDKLPSKKANINRVKYQARERVSQLVPYLNKNQLEKEERIFRNRK